MQKPAANLPTKAASSSPITAGIPNRATVSESARAEIRIMARKQEKLM